MREALDDSERALVDDASATGWYCLAAWTKVIRTMDKVHGNGDLTLCGDLARAGARRDVTPVLRALLSLTSPTFAIRNLTHLWSRQHNSGKWTVRTEDPHRVVLALDGWGVVDRAEWL